MTLSPSLPRHPGAITAALWKESQRHQHRKALRSPTAKEEENLVYSYFLNVFDYRTLLST